MKGPPCEDLQGFVGVCDRGKRPYTSQFYSLPLKIDF